MNIFSYKSWLRLILHKHLRMIILLTSGVIASLLCMLIAWPEFLSLLHTNWSGADLSVQFVGLVFYLVLISVVVVFVVTLRE